MKNVKIIQMIEEHDTEDLLTTENDVVPKQKPVYAQEKISGKAWGRVWFKFIRLPFPVFFIVWNEFCERFSFYGLRAVLTLFLTNFLNFRDDTATAIYHAFTVMNYLTPVGGAIISDSCLGKYGTIVSLSIVHAVGNVAMAVSAIPFNDTRGGNIGLTAVSLLIIAIGTGGIKPCVAAFGGDQFGKDKINLLPVFFSVFYFSINAGSVLSTILTPILRSYVQCFGEDTCFPLAFGVPAALMIASLMIFIGGTRWYLMIRPKREAAKLYLRVPCSIVYAIYRRIKYGHITGLRNFMDYASPQFSEKFVFDVYLLLRVLVMFIPLPVFWTLFDQQGSRWTLQAVRMDGTFGKYVIEPDQVQVLNPIFIIILIPVFETVVYPILHKCHILRKPLQRMVVGMVLAGLAFCMAGFLEIYIQSSSDRLGNGEARVMVSNAYPDRVLVHFGDRDVLNMSESEFVRFSTESLGKTSVNISALDGTTLFSKEVEINEKTINQLFVTTGEDQQINLTIGSQDAAYPDGDKASINLYVSDLNDYLSSDFDFALCEGSCKKSCEDLKDADYFEPNVTSNTFFLNFTEVAIGSYQVAILSANGACYEDVSQFQFSSGGIYNIFLTLNDTKNGFNLQLAEANSPNQVSILLQIPMYITITAGEVLFSITGLEFAYSQAPPSMKSMCQAAWLLTVAFGNLVVVIVAESSAFDSQAVEFFFFAAAIIAVSVIFAIMAYFYKYVDPAQLIADQAGEGCDKDSDNRTNLPGDSPGSHPKETYSLSDVENTQNGTTTKHIPSPSDEETEF